MSYQTGGISLDVNGVMYIWYAASRHSHCLNFMMTVLMQRWSDSLAGTPADHTEMLAFILF